MGPSKTKKGCESIFALLVYKGEGSLETIITNCFFCCMYVYIYTRHGKFFSLVKQ